MSAIKITTRRSITSTFNKAKHAVTGAGKAIAQETTKDWNKVKHDTSSAAHSVGHAFNNAIHKSGAWFVNAEHTVVRKSLKTVGQVTAWTNKAGQDIGHEVAKDARITAKGFGAAICGTAKHGDAIDMVWNDVAHPIIIEVNICEAGLVHCSLRACVLMEFISAEA